MKFYFDFISHNAWLAWTQIHPLAERYGQTVEPVPVLFAGMLNAHGQLGPAEVEPKNRWMLRDVLRKATHLGVPIAPPAAHPFNPLLALRAASQPRPAAQQHALVDGLFRAAWCESRLLSDPEVVCSVAQAAGLDGDKVLEDCQAPSVKQTLRQATDDALALGVFGVPSVVHGGEVFWGYDDLQWLDLKLAGRDPLPHDKLPPWESIRPAAIRPGSARGDKAPK